MSMNLCFTTKVGNHHVEFPYQTSSDITFAVLNEKTVEKKMSVIKKGLSYMEEDGYKRELLDQVEVMLEDSTLELGMI